MSARAAGDAGGNRPSRAEAEALLAALRGGDEPAARRALAPLLGLLPEALAPASAAGPPPVLSAEEAAWLIVDALRRFPDEASVVRACVAHFVLPLALAEVEDHGGDRGEDRDGRGGAPPPPGPLPAVLRSLAPPMLAALELHDQAGAVEPMRDCALFFALLVEHQRPCPPAAAGAGGGHPPSAAAEGMRAALARHFGDESLAYSCARYFALLSDAGLMAARGLAAAEADAAGAAAAAAAPELLRALEAHPARGQIALHVAECFAHFAARAGLAGPPPSWAEAAVPALLRALAGPGEPAEPRRVLEETRVFAAAALSGLAARPEGAAALKAAGGAPALLTALARHPESALVARMVAVCFANLAAHPSAEEGLGAAAPPLRAALARHPGDAPLARAAAACFTNLAACPRSPAVAAEEARLLLAARARHPGDAALARQVARFFAAKAAGAQDEGRAGGGAGGGGGGGGAPPG